MVIWWIWFLEFWWRICSRCWDFWHRQWFIKKPGNVNNNSLVLVCLLCEIVENSFEKMHKMYAFNLRWCSSASSLTLFRMERGGRGRGKPPPPPPTSFSSGTSGNVRICPKNFWLLVLSLLPLWCKILSSYLVLVPVPKVYT